MFLVRLEFEKSMVLRRTSTLLFHLFCCVNWYMISWSCLLLAKQWENTLNAYKHRCGLWITGSSCDLLLSAPLNVTLTVYVCHLHRVSVIRDSPNSGAVYFLSKEFKAFEVLCMLNDWNCVQRSVLQLLLIVHKFSHCSEWEGDWDEKSKRRINKLFVVNTVCLSSEVRWELHLDIISV